MPHHHHTGAARVHLTRLNMRQIQRFCFLACAAGLLALSSGCASYSVRSLPEVTNLPDPAQLDEFTLGADVPDTTIELRRWFDRDLIKYGVVPVFIYLQSSKDSESDFEIVPGKITLESSSGVALEQITAEDAYKRCRFSHWRALPMWLLFFPGVFVSHPLIAGANGRMERDFDAKRLRTTTLIARSPGALEGTVGVVYFAPKKGERLNYEEIKNGGVLSAQIRQSQGDSSGSTKPLVIVFN